VRTTLYPALQPTDRLLDIWSRDDRSIGGGGLHPLEVMRLLQEGQVLGPEQLSNDAVMIIVDQSILKSPADVQAFLKVWYKSHAPSHVKADRLQISRAALYTRWHAMLWYMRGTFRGKGLHV
jgi:hypothetical protein